MEKEIAEIVVGVDPGQNGAFVIMDLTGKALHVMDFVSPEITTLDVLALVFKYRLRLIAIEHVQAAPDQGRTGIFNFGTNFGYWVGLASTFMVPVLFPYPQTWQARRIPKKSHPKDKPSLPLAREEFPYVNLKEKQNADRTDALYISDWARVQWLKDADNIMKDYDLQIEGVYSSIRYKKRFGMSTDIYERMYWP